MALDALDIYVGFMTRAAQKLLEEALSLPMDQRAQMVSLLLQSLEGEDAAVPAVDLEGAWRDELNRRKDEPEADWASVREKLRSGLRNK